MKLKIGLAQNILYQFNIFCTGTKTNCTKVQIELQHNKYVYAIKAHHESAQWLEHLTGVQNLIGSIPVRFVS